MKILSLVLASLLSVSSLVGMDDSSFVNMDELKAELHDLFVEGLGIKCRCDRKMEKRCKRYVESAPIENFDEARFSVFEARLSARNEFSIDLEALVKDNAINQPDANGILPLQHALKGGQFTTAQLMLDGYFEGVEGRPAAVRLNFAQKNNNTFVKTLIDSITREIKRAPENDKAFKKYVEMKGAMVLNKLLQNGACADYHGTDLKDQREYARSKELDDMAELIKLARDKKFIAMTDLVLIIKDETMRMCQDA